MTLFSSFVTDPRAIGLLVALGLGLLIGAERERRKGEDEARGAAGVRTFAVVALAGALARLLGGELVLASVIVATGGLAMAAYLRSRKDDPGLTTEFALVLTAALGAFATIEPAMAAATGVAIVALLAIRTPLHRFVRNALSEDEVRDALVLAIAAFVIWPFLPAGALGPFGAFNPHAIWLVVILVMSIGALGHIAVRLLGTRLGIPIAGFFSGFISSSATIGALGSRAAANPETLTASVAGALLSTIATVVQMGVLLLAIDVAVARALVGPLVCAGLAATLYASFFVVTAVRNSDASPSRQEGRAFGIAAALLFGILFSAVLLMAAALENWLGERGAFAGVAVAGLVDVHAAAASVATLSIDGTLDPSRSAAPILAAFSTNTLTKIVLAFASRNRAYFARVAPGLVLVAAAAWAGALL